MNKQFNGANNSVCDSLSDRPLDEQSKAPASDGLRGKSPVLIRFAILALALLSVSALSVLAQTPATLTTTGIVVSSHSSTIVLRPEGRPDVLFAFNRFTIKPAAIPLGAVVRVTSALEGDLQVARTVTIVSQPTQPYQPTEPVPADIRSMESDIQKQVRRFGVGIRGGVALDQELVMIGGQARFGPFFNSNFSFRPSLEAGFGEASTLVAINLEGIYRLPLTMRQSKWSTYFGGGIGLNFNKLGLPNGLVASGEDVEIDNFQYDTVLTILVGVQFRSGMFTEIRAGAYGQPTIRIMLGYNF